MDSIPLFICIKESDITHTAQVSSLSFHKRHSEFLHKLLLNGHHELSLFLLSSIPPSPFAFGGVEFSPQRHRDHREKAKQSKLCISPLHSLPLSLSGFLAFPLSPSYLCGCFHLISDIASLPVFSHQCHLSEPSVDPRRAEVSNLLL